MATAGVRGYMKHHEKRFVFTFVVLARALILFAIVFLHWPSQLSDPMDRGFAQCIEMPTMPADESILLDFRPDL
jgi:hypothetical protein